MPIPAAMQSDSHGWVQNSILQGGVHGCHLLASLLIILSGGLLSLTHHRLGLVADVGPCLLGSLPGPAPLLPALCRGSGHSLPDFCRVPGDGPPGFSHAPGDHPRSTMGPYCHRLFGQPCFWAPSRCCRVLQGAGPLCAASPACSRPHSSKKHSTRGSAGSLASRIAAIPGVTRANSARFTAAQPAVLQGGRIGEGVLESAMRAAVRARRSCRTSRVRSTVVTVESPCFTAC